MPIFHDTSRQHARVLDQNDPLASYRDSFVIADPDLIYLDGNSLGRLPKAVVPRVLQTLQAEWGSELIRSWNQGWWDAASRVGDQIASILGASPGQVVVTDQTSVDLFKLAMAALGLRPERTRIVTDVLNFPSDLYVLQGVAHLLGNRHQIIRVPALDDGISPDLDVLGSSIDERTALVTLSHVAFKSGYLYDMQSVTDLAHRRGALVLWDLSHSAGAVPIALDEWKVDFAVGCTYKYLNGGPGAPAFLYANQGLHPDAVSPIWAWWGQDDPFAFGLDYVPASGVRRFQAGTAPILSLVALEAALPPLLEAGIHRLRAKSIGLTQYAIELSDARLAPLGFAVASPRDPKRRGSHVSLRHPDAYRINQALIEDMKVIPDFRDPDNIRLGFAPLYTSFQNVWDALDRLCRVMEEGLYEKYPRQRLAVT